jgi:hypothetical protein
VLYAANIFGEHLPKCMGGGDMIRNEVFWPAHGCLDFDVTLWWYAVAFLKSGPQPNLTNIPIPGTTNRTVWNVAIF